VHLDNIEYIKNFKFDINIKGQGLSDDILLFEILTFPVHLHAKSEDTGSKDRKVLPFAFTFVGYS
jgi:hypothetical protein